MIRVIIFAMYSASAFGATTDVAPKVLEVITGFLSF
jgi:hypothetical protein